MHDCKTTRERLNELAVSGEDTQSLAELRHCEACREEYESLRSTLRLADQALRSAPAEDFWPGYHARLRQRLESVSQEHAPTMAVEPSGALTWLRSLVTGSVRVPVPIAAVLLLAFVATILFAVKSRRARATVLPGETTVVTETVEVPVIHEKTVTRLVYRNRDRREGNERRGAEALAQRQNETGRAPVSLSGFTPTNEVKLTIIKGSYRDEK